MYVCMKLPLYHADHLYTHSLNRLYLAKWDPRDYPEPEAGQEQRVRDWIRAKYIEKRWCVRI